MVWGIDKVVAFFLLYKLIKFALAVRCPQVQKKPYKSFTYSTFSVSKLSH
jgi:hypothetical protein